MKNISILGSTGSIGENSLEVIRKNSELLSVYALAVNRSIDKLKIQIDEFMPEKVVIYDEKSYFEFLEKYNVNCIVLRGMDGLCEISSDEKVDIVLTSLVGSIGLKPTIMALKADKRVALANKETMVLAGDLINEILKEKGEIVPVDSEHSAIFQGLEGADINEIEKIIITASGGPFFDLPYDDFANISVAQALKHPKWSMGAKISIDSATMMNKGLEVIEAHYLFNVGYDKIEPVVHRQSFIHSMVEFVDGSIIAQMGVTNMQLPILHAFFYPERRNYHLKASLTDVYQLTFEKMDYKKFPLLSLAIECGKKGDGMPGVLNAANEVAVDAFLNEKIEYNDIYKVVYSVVDAWTEKFDIYNLESLLDLDSEARKRASKIVEEIQK